MRRVIRRTLVGIPVVALLASVSPVGEPQAQSPSFGSRATLEVLLCVGDPNSAGACGPTLKGRRRQGGSLRQQLQRGGRGGMSRSPNWGNSGARRAGWVRGPHGTCPEACSTDELREGQTVTLTARANNASYMEFKYWVADCEGLEFHRTCKVTVSGKTKVKAVFTKPG